MSVVFVFVIINLILKRNSPFWSTVVFYGRFMGFFQHCGSSAYCILTPNKFPHSSSEAPRIIQMRETSTSEGGNYYQFTKELGSFTCRKAGTWDIFFYFHSGGRHAEDFYVRKIQRLRPGLNPQTWVPEASMLTTRPPKPSSFYVRCDQFS